MEKSKKRRMSILKKQNDIEESSPTETLTLKNKRRISFSGKKSVKEFCAGENAETIWGTSYEESANSPASKQDPPFYNFKNDIFNAFQNRHPLNDKEHWVYKQKNFIAQQNSASNEKKNSNFASNEKKNYADIRPKFKIDSPQTTNICPKFEIGSEQTTIEDLSLKETNKRLNCTVNRSEQNILKVCRDFDDGSSITLNGSECNIVKNLREKLKSPKKNLKNFAEFDENTHFNNTDINMSLDRMNTTEGFLKIEIMIENSLKQNRKTLLLNDELDNHQTIIANENIEGHQTIIANENIEGHQTIIANETIEPEFLDLSINKSKNETFDKKIIFSNSCKNMVIVNMDEGNDCKNFENSDINHKTSLAKNNMDETTRNLSSIKPSFAVNFIDNLSSNFKIEGSNATDNFNDLEDTQAMLNQLDHPSRYFEGRLSTKSSSIVIEKENKPLHANDISVFDALDMSIDYELQNSNTKTGRKENEIISNAFELSIEENNNNRREIRNTLYEAINFSVENSAQNIVPNEQIRCEKKNHKRKTINNSIDMCIDEDITKYSLQGSQFENTVGSSKNEESINKSLDLLDTDEKLKNENFDKSQENNVLNITDESFFKAQEKLREISFKESALRKEIIKSFRESVVNNMLNTKMKTESQNDETDNVKERNEISQSLQKEIDVKTNDTIDITITNLQKDFKESFDIPRFANMDSGNITNETDIFKKPFIYNKDFNDKIQQSTTKFVNSLLDMDLKNEKVDIVDDNYAKTRTEKRQTINFQEEKIQNDMEISLINDISEDIFNSIDIVEEQTVEIQNSVINHGGAQFGNNFKIKNSSRKSAGENISKRIESNEHSCRQIIPSENKTIKSEKELNFGQDKNTEDKFEASVLKRLKNIHKNTPPEAPSLKRSNTICINDNLETEDHDKNLQVLGKSRKSIIFEYSNNDIIEDEKNTEVNNEFRDECNPNITDTKKNMGVMKNTRKTIIFENDNMLENKTKVFEAKNSRTFEDLELTGINALDDSNVAHLQSHIKIPSNNELDSINKMDVEIYNQKSDCQDIKLDKSIDDKIIELSKSILNYQAPTLDLDSSDEELSLVEENRNLSYLCNLPTPVINKNLSEIPKISITNASMELTSTKSIEANELAKNICKKERTLSSNLSNENSPRKEILLGNSTKKNCEPTTNNQVKCKMNDISNTFRRNLNFVEVPNNETQNNTSFSCSKSFFNISESSNDEIIKTKMILLDSSESSIDTSKVKDENEKNILKVSHCRRSSLNKKVCSRCKRCRLSLDKTEIVNFKLESESLENVDFSILDKYKNYTTLQDVWRAHERRQANTYALDLNNVNWEKNSMKSDINLGKYFTNFQIENCFPMGNKFEIELTNKISNINNTWKVKVCSYYNNNFIILTYIPCPTIELVIECTPVNFHNFDSKFNKIYTRQSYVYAEESWSPNNKLIFMEFKKLIPSNEVLYNKFSKLKELNECLQFFNGIIEDIMMNVKKLMKVIIISRGSLERHGDKVAVHKMYYDKSSDKKTLVIEINRIKEISIKNIISPHISEFSTAAIKGFPIGIKFVELILNDLNSYMS